MSVQQLQCTPLVSYCIELWEMVSIFAVLPDGDLPDFCPMWINEGSYQNKN